MNPLNPKLSLAIVNWNTRELLLKCLASLRVEARRMPLEVIVVDNGSQDSSGEAVRRLFPEVVLIANQKNRGFAAATNQALAQAKAPFWGLLNPDTEVRPGALEIMVATLEQNPELMVVGPQLLYGDNTIQPSGRKFPTLFRTWLDGVLPARIRQSSWWKKEVFGRTDFSVPTLVDEVSGACLVARQDAFQRNGLLDEQFFIYFEEVDWFMRLVRQGGKVRYEPRAQVFHHWSAAVDQLNEEGILFNYESAFKFWRKYRGWQGELIMRGISVFHVMIWCLAGIFCKPWQDLPKQWRRYGKILGLALNLWRVKA